MLLLGVLAAAGQINQAQKNRATNTHFGLNNPLEMLRANGLSTLKTIHLMYLSNDNADEGLIKGTVQSMVGYQVAVVVCGEKTRVFKKSLVNIPFMG